MRFFTGLASHQWRICATPFLFLIVFLLHFFMVNVILAQFYQYIFILYFLMNICQRKTYSSLSKRSIINREFCYELLYILTFYEIKNQLKKYCQKLTNKTFEVMDQGHQFMSECDGLTSFSVSVPRGDKTIKQVVSYLIFCSFHLLSFQKY